MNYFAHGLPHLAEPYLLAGTAVPDWLNVADRSVRVRSKQATLLVDSPEAALADVARGIVQHHQDDAWFHDTTAFHELCWQFTAWIRDTVPDDEGFRPSLLGHILVEILLDAELIGRHPAQLEQYYQALEQIDAQVVEAAVNRIAARATERLALLVPLFCSERFLWDYLDDGKLLMRLNQVMRRVRLPTLPEAVLDVLPRARFAVAARTDELLAGRN
jgi:hypothetical protein